MPPLQQFSQETFSALSKSAALLLSVAAAFMLSWRGRAKWEPSEEDIPGALNQLARLLTAVTMVLMLTQLSEGRNAGTAAALMIASLVGCLACFFAYAYLTATHTYKASDTRFVIGFRLQPNLELRDGETMIEYARRVGDPDKVWTASSRAGAKLLFALCYLGLNVLGSATLILAVLAGPRAKEATITYPANGNGIQELEKLAGVARNFPADEIPWVVVVPWDSRKFCPQNAVSVDANGNWSLLVQVGLEHDVGQRFDLMLVGVDRAAEEQFKTYVSRTKVSVVHPGLDSLPPGSNVLANVTVRRQ